MLYKIDIGVFLLCAFHFFSIGSGNYRKDDITLLAANIKDESAAEGILP